MRKLSAPPRPIHSPSPSLIYLYLPYSFCQTRVLLRQFSKEVQQDGKDEIGRDVLLAHTPSLRPGLAGGRQAGRGGGGWWRCSHGRTTGNGAKQSGQLEWRGFKTKGPPVIWRQGLHAQSRLICAAEHWLRAVSLWTRPTLVFNHTRLQKIRLRVKLVHTDMASCSV